MDLADRVYDAADLLPKTEQFVLSEQMRDAALSVPANIAEGKGRWSIREYRQFARHARGSLMELQSHLLFAGRRKYISVEMVNELIGRAERVGEKLNALIRYLNRRAKKPHDPRPTTDDHIPRRGNSPSADQMSRCRTHVRRPSSAAARNFRPARCCGAGTTRGGTPAPGLWPGVRRGRARRSTMRTGRRGGDLRADSMIRGRRPRRPRADFRGPEPTRGACRLTS